MAFCVTCESLPVSSLVVSISGSMFYWGEACLYGDDDRGVV